MAEDSTPRPRRSRAEVTEALIDAAAVLYAETPSSQVTVRSIAAAADVDPAMVNRYFGTKDGLVRAVVERSQNRMTAQAVEVNRVRDDIEVLLHALLSEKAFVAVLARACLDDTLPELPAGYPGMEVVVRRLKSETDGLGDGGIDPQIVAASLVALGLGYALYGDYIRQGTGLDDRPSAEIEAGIAEVARRVVDTAFE